MRSVDSWAAYLPATALQRSEERRAGMTRHAVSHQATVLGLAEPDAECGKLVALELGAWDGAHPKACRHCRAYVAGAGQVPMPAELRRAPEYRPLWRVLWHYLTGRLG